MTDPSTPQPPRPPIDNSSGSGSYTPPPPPSYNPPPNYGGGGGGNRGGGMTRLITGLIGSILLISIVLNIYLGMFVAAQFAGPVESVYEEGDASQRIVILPVNNMIVEDTARGIRRSLKALRDNPPKALVLRVDSGGGTVGASDRIHHELLKFKEETGVPVVASFGSLAASGGYYIAAPCDYIMAENTSVTGSIGVMAQAFTIEGLLEKVGVTPEVHVARSSPEKDVANDIMHAWDEKDRNLLRDLLDRSHERFLEVVYQGRKDHITEEDVKKIADGRIYTTAEAIDNGLVDEQGYLDAAIDKAASLAGISGDPHVTVMSPPKPFSLMAMMTGSQRDPGLSSLNGSDLRNLLADLATPRLEYRMPPLR